MTESRPSQQESLLSAAKLISASSTPIPNVEQKTPGDGEVQEDFQPEGFAGSWEAAPVHPNIEEVATSTSPIGSISKFQKDVNWARP